jgi:hypothetical protein
LTSLRTGDKVAFSFNPEMVMTKSLHYELDALGEVVPEDSLEVSILNPEGLVYSYTHVVTPENITAGEIKVPMSSLKPAGEMARSSDPSEKINREISSGF